MRGQNQLPLGLETSPNKPHLPLQARPEAASDGGNTPFASRTEPATRRRRRRPRGPTILAIRPGSRATSLVIRRASRHLGHALVTRRVDPDSYPQRVIDAIASWRRRWPDSPLVLAYEDPRLAPVLPRHGRGARLAACGCLLGFLQQRFPDAIRVAPREHYGNAPLISYPNELLTRQEREHARQGRVAARPQVPSRSLSSARQAWDIAAAAADLLQRCRHTRTAPPPPPPERPAAEAS